MEIIKPRYKRNSGMGATLCHNCNVIIQTGQPVKKYLCNDCRKDHKILREEFYWGVNFNKHGVSTGKTIRKPLPELTDNHLINIIRYFEKQDRLPNPFISNELLFRQEYPVYSVDETRSKFVKQYISPIIRFFGKLMGRYTTNII